MKHLRRNRSTSISTPCASSSNPPSVSAPAPLSARAAAAAAAERTSHEAPLYARFAGARRAPDGSGPSLKPLVSAPLALAPRKVVQVAVPVPAPGSVQAPAMKQQKSSEGRDRDRDRDVRGEVEKAKSRSEMRHEASQDERLKVSEHGRDRKDSGVGAQEMRRMPSEGTALSGESSSGNASASGVVLGRHGTRVEGDRVLLPARKVTRKRVDTTASGSSSRPDETRPVEGTSDETGAENGRGAASSARKARRERERERQWEREQVRVVGERVLLPARKMTRPRVDAASLPQPESLGSSSGTDPPSQEDTIIPSESTASTSTLVPAPGVRPSFEGSRHDHIPRATVTSSPNTAAPSGSGRTSINEEARREKRRKEKKHTAEDASAARAEKVHARTRSPEPQVIAGQTSSSSNVPYIAFPASGPSLSSGNSAQGRNGGGGSRGSNGAAAVVVVDGEDQFSTPKRASMHTIATSKPASPPALSGAGASNDTEPSSQPRPSSPVKQRLRPGGAEVKRPQAIKESASEGDKARAPAAADGVASSASTSSSTIPGPKRSVPAPASSLTSPPSTGPTPATSSSHSKSNSKENAPAPRRRKYSLLAALGLPVGKSTSDSDRDTSTAPGPSRHANAGANVSENSAKPPTPPPPSTTPSPPAVSGDTPARDATEQIRTENGLPSKKEEKRRVPGEQQPDSSTAYSSVSASVTASVHTDSVLHSNRSNISATTRDRRAPLSSSPEPQPQLQLHSLHLSGFNFPLDALLAADESSDGKPAPTAAPTPPPVPPIPHATVTASEPPRTADHELEQPSRRPSDSLNEQRSPSDSPASEDDCLPKQPSSSAPPRSKPCSKVPDPPALVPAPASVPAKSPPVQHQHQHQHQPQQQQQHPKAKAKPSNERQNLHNIPRTIDLDHSLLPPESDTRYPIPRRRSPTHPPTHSAAPAASSSTPPAPSHSKKPSSSSKAKMLPAQAQSSYPSPPHAFGKPPSDYQAGYPPTHRGPIQGRPLIFAAMAAAEAEAEIIDPKAWMAVATLDPDAREESAEMPPRLERSDGSSQFVSGYPTPRSTSPKSPEPKDRRAMHESIPAAAAPATGRHNSDPPNADYTPLKEQAAHRPSASNLRSPPPTMSTSLPTPPESHPPQPPRMRKLSKSRSRVSRMPDAPPSQAPAAQTQMQQQSPPPTSQSPPYPHPRAQMGTPLTAAPSATFGAKPPTPVEDMPPPPHPPAREPSSRHRAQGDGSANAHVHAYGGHQQQPGHGYSSAGANYHNNAYAPVVPAASTTAANAQLGSPIHLRHEKSLPERRSTEPVRSPPPAQRVISSESPVPTRPVKVLTERQMEKLNATKGFVAPGAGASAQSARRRHEQPVPVGSPPLHNRSLPSQSARSEQHSRPRQDTSRVVGEADPGSRVVNEANHSSRVMNETAPATPQKTEKVLPAPDMSSQAQSSPPRSPISPEEYAQARTRRRGKALEKSRPEGIENVVPVPDPISASGAEHQPDVGPSAEVAPEPLETEEEKEPTFYPLERHIAEPALLAHLLAYLSFGNWLALSSASKAIRARLHDDRELTERALERYLRTVGYARWTFAENEPLTLTLEDLNAYMRGVSLPAHQFSRYAEMYLQTPDRERDRAQSAMVQSLQVACRSYTRVVLRLRAQAEADARAMGAAGVSPTSPQRGLPSVKSTTSVNNVPAGRKTFSRSSSRAPSPTSSFSHSHSGHGIGFAYTHGRNGSVPAPGPPAGVVGFHSPLFRVRRAPLLQVFVPSPEGDWLSDTSVLECENELRRAGVQHLLRPGDVVWDTAVGDEGNVGRMVWDGGYLIDLDYTYSRAGDLPKYLPTLAFPPSYFHRVVRTMGSGNPICHIDIAPWGEEIAANLQLLQDRTKTETPQGGHHMVVRWVHRSSFTIRPSASGKPLRIAVPRDVGPGPAPGGAWLVDPGWYGTVVVEAEGTNEGLADLQARCRGAFPPRAAGAIVGLSPDRLAREEEQKSVFRILREKSRPGEIWIRTVTAKERLLPP